MRSVSVYLHIPFCRRKCAYCDFPSWAGRENQMEAVVCRMEEEIRTKAREDLSVDQVFLGGGTPSCLPVPLLDRLFKALRAFWRISPEAEISMEINPGTLHEELLDSLPRWGVNRVSMGMQTADPGLLAMLGRIHTPDQVVRGVGQLRDAGIGNLNLDLMIGLPGQELRMVRESLEEALALGVPHLSCYSLIVEEGTPLARRLRAGEITLPEEDTERKMYELCRQKCFAAGLRQYEISNFALPGRECRYNLSVWRRGEYVGIGCAAAGFLDGERTVNPGTPEEYLAGKEPVRERISFEDACFESVMLGLRLTEGIRDEEFIRRHGISLREAFGDRLDVPVREGLVQFRDGVLQLTRRGLDLQNRVLVALMPDSSPEK